jgi:hypothetical protein
MAKRVPLITDVDFRRMVLESTLNKEQRYTLLVLKHAMYADSLRIIASYQRLAGYLALGRRQTINRVRDLEDLEVLVKVREGGGRYESGSGRVNVWQLDLDALYGFVLLPEPKTNPRPAKDPNAGSGATHFTPKGATHTREGCNGQTEGVKPGAHNPRNQLPPNNLANNPPSKPAGVALEKMQAVQPIRIPIPKAPRFAQTPQSREERLAALRAQAALAKGQDQAAPSGSVQFSPEGGVSDGFNRE